MSQARMTPLAEWPIEERRLIRGVLTDIDDTLTTHGRMLPDTLAAISSLRDAGYRIIAVTGRPTYWAMPLLRLCGFDAVIAENGASAFWPGEGGRTASWFYADAATRKAHRARLESFALVMQERFPEVQIAEDAPQRVGDLAFDIGEFAPPLPADKVAEVLDFIRKHGFHATSSSIHAHASLAPFCKQVASERLLREVFGTDDDEARRTYAFVGDSGNDARMFAHYPYSIGVANVTSHLSRLPVAPRFVASQAYGAGFVEVARCLPAARGS
ncbi:HAD family hydrolase [Noviherbaspirillum galbum]|uniref:HAD family phosphatase n=1 Tax=Noviherbaspirillum galbum TaxID=2709383 RepID=A0A6B3SMJ4_9BURK|nr:HAD family hydrolase [Noviherbaspirillum galbum]NEX62074.1 HAD family phosphatase [Noviherbaspirillum galbum]